MEVTLDITKHNIDLLKLTFELETYRDVSSFLKKMLEDDYLEIYFRDFEELRDEVQTNINSIIEELCNAHFNIEVAIGLSISKRIHSMISMGLRIQHLDAISMYTAND